MSTISREGQICAVEGSAYFSRCPLVTSHGRLDSPDILPLYKAYEKRPDRAIEIAKRAGIPLKLAAKVDAVDLEYFETEIEPLLDHPLIEFIGEINETQKCEFLGKARALLFPIDWPEPFGLVMIEAMSAGTPVIAWRNGSVNRCGSHRHCRQAASF